jgi:hypothetical protein
MATYEEMKIANNKLIEAEEKFGQAEVSFGQAKSEWITAQMNFLRDTECTVKDNNLLYCIHCQRELMRQMAKERPLVACSLENTGSCVCGVAPQSNMSRKVDMGLMSPNAEFLQSRGWVRFSEGYCNKNGTILLRNESEALDYEMGIITLRMVSCA